MEINLEATRKYSEVIHNCETYGGGYLRRLNGKTTPEPFPYNVCAVIDAAEAYLRDNRAFHNYHDNPDTRMAGLLKGYSGGSSYALRNICAAVNADVSTVIAVVKSFRRYAEYHYYGFYNAQNHMSASDIAGFRRVVQCDSPSDDA